MNADLGGLGVVITRSSAQASTLATALRGVNAEPIEVATIDIRPPADGGEGLRVAVGATPDWVVLTSANGVDAYLEVTEGRGLDTRHAVVGSTTLDRLGRAGVTADLVPDRFVAAALVESFGAGPGTVLYPAAAAALPTVEHGLTAKGWSVQRVEAYRNEAAEVSEAQRAGVVAAGAITFASASAVQRFASLIGIENVPPVVVCIGPVTAAAAEQAGLVVDAVAQPHTIDGLVAALVEVSDGAAQ